MQFLLLLFCAFFEGSLPLRIAHLSVPPYRVRGQTASLTCDYDLGSDKLYSVKWYRDNEEFYRYMPGHYPPKHSYRLDGVKVDLSQSSDKHVSLQHVTLRSSGVYRCEVSAEAPSFSSAARESKMEVLFLPREGPRITGHEVTGGGKDRTVLNCTSGRSHPAAVLSWDIDGKKVTDLSLLLPYPPVEHPHGLKSAALGLRLPAGGARQVRCTAVVAPAWAEGRDAVVGETEPVADSREAMLLVRSFSTIFRVSNKLAGICLLFLLLRDCHLS